MRSAERMRALNRCGSVATNSIIVACISGPVVLNYSITGGVISQSYVNATMQHQATLPPIGRAPPWTIECESSRCVSHHSAQSSSLRLRCQSRLPPHRRIWPPGRSGVPACLSLASADRLCAICHLSHALIWEYNIPQWLAVARHVVSAWWLKFQRRPYRSRPA